MDLREMKELSFHEAYEYFMERENYASRTADFYMRYISKKCDVKDLRGTLGIPQEIYKGGWLIVVDGETCAGKTTIAKKIQKKYPGTVKIVNVDGLTEKWLEKQIESLSFPERMRYFRKIEEQRRAFLSNNLEKIIEEEAKEGKTVVLDGCFLEFVFRAFLGTTMERYFRKVAFITVHEAWEELQAHCDKREKELGSLKEIAYEQAIESRRQFSYVDRSLLEKRELFGYGADLSLIVDSRTKLF